MSVFEFFRNLLLSCKSLRKKFSYKTYFLNYSYLCNAMHDDCSWCGAYIVGQALHNGKASHDALSIGHLKLPQKIAYQRQCKDDATGMLNMYPRCVLEG